MTSEPQPSTGAAPEPSWGLGDALGGWLLAMVLSALSLPPLLAAFGYAVDDDLPLEIMTLQYIPLWVGFVGVPVWAAVTKGSGFVRDFRVRLAAIDVAVAVAVGVLAQLILVPLVSWPVLELAGSSFDELAEPARELGDKAVGPLKTFLLFAIVGVGAPIAEEIFYRGLVLGALAKRFGTTWAVIGSSVLFGLSHFQLLQLPALVVAGAVFALLYVRTGRLGAAIIGHMAFNAVTVGNLVWGSV